jgi:SPP1 gp7 family putative phage head morphogenesis protein
MASNPPRQLSRLERAINRYYSGLDNLEAQSTNQLNVAYSQALHRVDEQIAKVNAQIYKAQAAGLNTDTALSQKARLTNLSNQISEVLLDFHRDTAKAITKVKSGATEAGQQAFIDTAKGSGIDPVVGVAFDVLPSQALNQLQSRLSDGSPVSRIIDVYRQGDGEYLRRALNEGIALGINPRQVAANMRQQVLISKARAETLARTEMMHSFRESNRQTMLENNDIVKSWKWYCSLDRRTCPMCWAMHGTIHPLTDKMATHPNCRCTMLPVTKTFKELGLNVEEAKQPPQLTHSGDELFNLLSESDKERILGPAAYRAFKDGVTNGSLKPFVKETDNYIWGQGRSVRSLREILGPAGAGKYYRQPSIIRPKVAAGKYMPLIEHPQVTRQIPINANDPDWVKAAKSKINGGIETHEDAIELGGLIRRQIQSEVNPEKLLHHQRELEHYRTQELYHRTRFMDLAKNKSLPWPNEVINAQRDWQEAAFHLKNQQQLTRRASGFDRLNVIKHLKQIDSDYGSSSLADLVIHKTPNHDSEIENMVKRVGNLLPKSWVKAFKEYEVATEQSTRGFFQRATPFNRFFTVAADRFGTIEATTIHELTHFAEYTRKHVGTIVRQFFDYRTAGEPTVKLNDVLPESGYQDFEVTKIDNFISPYMGKVYNESPEPSTEILTMGTMDLLSDEREFRLAEDPEYLDFILGMLLGDSENQEEIDAEVRHEELVARFKRLLPTESPLP